MENTALIVLDLINGITESEHYKPYLIRHQVMIKANQLIAYARKKHYLIIFVKVGFSDQYVELAHRSPLFIQNKIHGRLKLSEKSTDFAADLDYHAEDIVMIKHRINAFYGTALEAILQTNDIQNLILCGVSTNLAVEGTARDAHDRNYHVIVAEDACGTTDEENQEKSLSLLRLIAEVKKVREICQEE